MKKLSNLKKSLPSNARLSNMEHTRIKGGNGDKRTGDSNRRPSNKDKCMIVITTP